MSQGSNPLGRSGCSQTAGFRFNDLFIAAGCHRAGLCGSDRESAPLRKGSRRPYPEALAAVSLMGSGFVPNSTVAYTYDSLNRLTQAVLGDGRTIAYTWDAAGN